MSFTIVKWVATIGVLLAAPSSNNTFVNIQTVIVFKYSCVVVVVVVVTDDDDDDADERLVL